MKSRVLKKKDGAALLIAMIVMMVVLALGFSLVMVSYMLSGTVHKQRSADQCRELVRSFGRLLETEIAEDPQFQSYEEQREAQDGGQYPLWFYLRYNVGQETWPYYSEDERGHRREDAVREYQLELPAELAETVDALGAAICWKKGGADEIFLEVQVSCTSGSRTAAETTVYRLEEQPYEGGQAGADTCADPMINPDGNQIGRDVRWNWKVTERR